MGRYFGLYSVVSLACALAAHADTATFTPDKDNTLIQDAVGTLSNGAGQQLFVGRTNQIGNIEIRRALMHFNLSSLPAGANVTSASLRLVGESNNNGARTLVLHRLLQDWGQGTSNSAGRGAPATSNDATWIYRFYNPTSPTSSPTWTTPGGSFSSTNTASALCPASGGAFTFTSTSALLSDVNFWLANPASNFGWELIGDESGPKTAKIIYSREFSTAANRPTLTVTYTVPEPALAFLSALSFLSLRRRPGP